MLPNFVVIGAQKAGTTAVWHYLRQHPQIFMTPMKEPHFFSIHWSRGRAWYESLFDSAGEEVVAIGEASPNYTCFPVFPEVPKRMANLLPSARLVYILRDPIDRIRSSYLHDLTHGLEARPIAEAVQDRLYYLAASRYATQIEQYLEFYDRSQILLVLSEDFAREPAAVLDRILSFLGLASGWRPPDLGVRQNVTAMKRVPRAWARGVGRLMIKGRIPELPLPESFARSVWATRPLTAEDTAVPDEVRSELEEILRPEVERLRPYMPPGFDGWGLIR